MRRVRLRRARPAPSGLGYSAFTYCTLPMFKTIRRHRPSCPTRPGRPSQALLMLSGYRQAAMNPNRAADSATSVGIRTDTFSTTVDGDPVTEL